MSEMSERSGKPGHDGRLEVQTEDLRLVLQLSSAAIRPGQKVLLRAELQVNPGLHIPTSTHSINWGTSKDRE